MKKRILSLLLALAFVLSCAPAAVAAETRTGFSDGNVIPHSTEGPVRLPVDTLDESEVNGVADGVGLPASEGKFADYGVEPFHQSEAAQKYQATDKVTFIVEMENKPLLETYSADEISAQSASVMKYQDKQEVSLNALKTNLAKAFGASEDFRINFTYTVATTGVSVTTEYGNKAEIEAMPGVKKVYVAPMFSLPNDTVSEEINLTPSTGNSSGMIGANVLNNSGYTGKGTRIAILDTGIKLDHPNFAPLPEEKLENPLTIEEIEAVWNELKAGKSNMLKGSTYYNTKIPFIFNYVEYSLNMDHMYAGSDHGTHVAGIAAGNKIDSSDVVGMAPDAQLVIMQVFNPGGGASWDTIMAALEDCIWLDVDAANLSLGAAAGFTDHDAESAMNQVLGAFEDTDIEVLIASGNDTNNAYQNLWGQNMSLAGNPDIGLAGTPSTYKSAFAVASIDNDAVSTLYFTVDGIDIPYDDSANTNETKFHSNFWGQTLDFVMVPGVGDVSDYENIDVEGKVAVVSRGTIQFLQKQANAQAAGAIACVVYNNVNDSFLMQINDGGDNIPCVSISKASGEILKNAATKKLTVCEAVATLKVPAAASSFSSWGVTPDLKLKPEIAGVGGQVKSATDPQISGSLYSTWDGTSMATPQVAGAAAVLKQYFRENYPQFAEDEGELRRVMANMMMSTAQVIMNGDVPYSPRHQGSGLVDLVDATSSGAFLSNPEAHEGRPKGEMGDDDQRTGAFQFPFEINNFSDEDLTYTFDSAVLTETLVNDTFIGNTATELEAKIQVVSDDGTSIMKYDFNGDGRITTADARALLLVVAGAAEMDAARADYYDVNGDGEVNKADADVITAYCAELEVDVNLEDMDMSYEQVDSITVPAGQTVKLTAQIQLTENDIAVVEQFPNGIYVEGFLYVNSADEEGTDMNMPFVGFYGNWSDAPLFDEADPDEASLYPIYVFTNAETLLGANPYFRNGKTGDQYTAVSHSLPLAAIEFGQLRNALRLDIVVTDLDTNEEYFRLEASNLGKTHYSASYGMIVPSWVEAYYGEMWDGKDASGNYVEDGTRVKYELIGYLDDGDEIVDDTFSFEYTVDSTAPVVENAADLQSDLRFDGDRTYLTLNLKDNRYISALFFMSPEGIVMGKYEVDNVPGETFTGEYEITGFGSEFTILVADFAINEREYDVMLNLGDQNLARPTPIELDKNRLYGSETFDGALVEGGWFSAKKSDFSEPRNETFDSANRYYAAEYVNGYLVAQHAGDGDLYLVTPSGTYWSIQKMVENQGEPNQYGFWVFYDMAMDYSGEKDRLYAVGWYYMGDNDNNGNDDGYNALFEIVFTEDGYVYVQPVGRINGVPEGSDLLTLGITTEGKAYGIDTAAKFYSLDLNPVYDETVGDWGADVINATYLGTTDFATYPGAKGANVIQSMGYDHNDGVMYWYAHSQVQNGLVYDNINVTYKVNLTDGSCTEVGSYGPAGQTALFVPHDIESDLFAVDVQATGFELNPYSMAMVEGQSKRVNVKWNPWNAKPVEVTWSVEDDTIASVDKYGFVTGLKEGNTTVYATAEVLLPGSWDTSTNPWTWIEGGMGDLTVSCQINVLPTQDEIYGFVIADFKDATTVNSWLTYSAKDPTITTNLGSQKITVQDGDGNDVVIDAMWYGGAYYNGYVYTTMEDQFVQDNTIYHGTALYRSKVTQGTTPDQTVFGEPERIGFAEGVILTNLAFDYTTSRMYALENQALGGLGIVDLDNGNFDYLGTFTGDLVGPTYTTAMAVTKDGTIVVAGQNTNLYKVDPDTMQTTTLYMKGTDDSFAPYYAAMAYDYDTDAIYWNPCNSASTSPLLMVTLGEFEWDTQVIDLGDVSTKYGVEQTVIFTIPENEPEAQVIPVQGIEITDGDQTGLLGGTMQLTTVTTPLRPSNRTVTWTSSNPDVADVDKLGIVTYKGLGSATITASITNKDQDKHGGPFEDSIEVTVIPSAGRFEAFLAADEGGSGYYDFWINFNDYDLDDARVGQSMISTLSLRVGTYYDGYYYGYNDRGAFVRVDAANPTVIKTLGTLNRDTLNVQITGMAMDYTTGTMYGLTLPTNYSYYDGSITQLGELVTIDLDTGEVTTVATLDFNNPVFALACDKHGQLYAAGGFMYMYSETTNIYKLSKTDGALELYTTIEGAGVYTGPNYYGTPRYNAQMTYDFGTDRLYLNATTDRQEWSASGGFYMVQLGEETPSSAKLGTIALNTRSGSPIRYGDVYLGLLASVPEVEELPAAPVNGIIMSKESGRVALGQTTQLTANVRPSNAEDTSVKWTSSNPEVATVDETGLVTGLTTGTTTITATSNQTGVSGKCEITVVEISDTPSKAYTYSANKGAMMTFNPELPAQTAVIDSEFTLNNIVAVTYGKDCLYIVDYVNSFNYLYRYDLKSHEVTLLTRLETWFEVDDMAYDAENDLLYTVAGFYVHQFDLVNNLDPTVTFWSGFWEDSDNLNHAGIEVINGDVYTLGTDLYSNEVMLVKYEGKFMNNRTVIKTGLPMNCVQGNTDMAYDPATGLFYISDASEMLYTMDTNGENITGVDILGDGIDFNGLVILPPEE